MGVLVRSRGLLFIQTPRTGCTALAEGVLVPQMGGVEIPEHDVDTPRGRVQRKHVTLAEMLELGVLTHDDLRHLVPFTTVRNPYDRLVSAYEGRREKSRDGHRPWVAGVPGAGDDVEFALNHDFTDWVHRRLAAKGPRTLWRSRPIAPRHMTARYLEGVDEVLRFESLQEDFDALLERLGIAERYEIPTLNVTAGRRGRDYRTYYDDVTRELVATVYAPDLERFGYGFDPAP